jgi:glutaminyl-peptide cyclotransferase
MVGPNRLCHTVLWVRFRLWIAVVGAALLLCSCGGSAQPVGSAAAGGGSAARFDAQRAFADLRAQVGIGPRVSGTPGGRREAAFIVRRLREAGVRHVRVQRPLRNVVATLPGSRPGTVVVGAHYDTKGGIPGFVGANDGASGVAVLLELARSLPRPLPGPAVTLAFFDAEEARPGRSFESDGARGSRQFVRLAREGRQGAPRLAEIRAMYLLDMVGDCDLHIPREQISDPRLYEGLRGPAFGGVAAPVLDDQQPFTEAGVPAVDLIDFRYGPGPVPGRWWHTRADDLAHVCAGSLGQAGRAVAAVVARP